MYVKGFEPFKISTTRSTGKRWYCENEIKGWKECNPSQYAFFDNLRSAIMKRSYDPSNYEDYSYVANTISLILENEDSSCEEYKNYLSKSEIKNLCKDLINFFSEFHFEPNFRFLNTLYYQLSIGNANTYVANYFSLADSPYTYSVKEKMKSSEWQDMMDRLAMVDNPSRKINGRFKIYYGSQGTGKTTIAARESNGDCMVCHSAMLPSDLMEDFQFDDGKAGFHKSSLYQAIENGTKIVLDEINLLPFESLRFLQGILDGKEKFIYKGQEVVIKDGFEIIGTMNLVVNGSTFSLPEPLIDRAYDLKEFRLTADNLAEALM